MIIAFSGHRPDKIGGYKIPNPTYDQICAETEALLIELKPEKCISGMALGFDQYAASVCIKLGIPFVAAVPFVGQEKIWPQSSKDTYNDMLKQAADIVVVSDGGYAPYKMQVRNEWMINNCDEVVCCWDGSKGGTFNCVQYAEQQNKPIHRIIPNV